MEVKVPGADWLVVARDGEIAHEGLRDTDGNAVRSKGGKLTVPHRSALILAREKLFPATGGSNHQRYQETSF